MLSEGQERDIAITMWMSMAENTTDETKKTYALMKLQREQNLIMIEEALANYPGGIAIALQDLSVLVDAGLLSPGHLNDPFSTEDHPVVYQWDAEDQRVTTVVK